MIVTYHYKDNFSAPKDYSFRKLPPPLQTPTARTPFSLTANQQTYTITPKFDYELTGVVVSSNDADGFTNIWHHQRWKDFINVRDVCVIWDPNVASGVYEQISFSSDSWTCWVSWNDKKTSDLFKSSALSNNHILTSNNTIKSLLLTAEKGDVIHFKGVLADYTNNGTGATRLTSTRRDDNGNGACETVYIEEFRIVKKANPRLRALYQLSKWTTILSLIGFLIMAGITPFKSRH